MGRDAIKGIDEAFGIWVVSRRPPSLSQVASPCKEYSAYLSDFKETTSGLEPLTCSLRVSGQGLRGVAGAC